MYWRLGTQYSFGYNPLFERIAKAPAHRNVISLMRITASTFVLCIAILHLGCNDSGRSLPADRHGRYSELRNGIFSDYCKRASKEAAIRTSTCFDGEWIYTFNRSSADGTSITIAGLSDWLSIARSPCKPVFWYKGAVSCEEFFRYLDDENQKCDDCVVYTASFATG